MISGREAYGAYTKFATETAILAITVAKSPFFLPYDDGYSIIPNRSLGPISSGDVKVFSCSPESKECLPLIYGSHKT